MAIPPSLSFPWLRAPLRDPSRFQYQPSSPSSKPRLYGVTPSTGLLTWLPEPSQWLVLDTSSYSERIHYEHKPQNSQAPGALLASPESFLGFYVVPGSIQSCLPKVKTSKHHIPLERIESTEYRELGSRPRRQTVGEALASISQQQVSLFSWATKEGGAEPSSLQPLGSLTG